MEKLNNKFMSKNDEIMFDKREELAEEHPFLRTELGQYAFQLGFDAATKSVLERVYEWVRDNYLKECGTLGFENTHITLYQEPALEALRKAMEE